MVEEFPLECHHGHWFVRLPGGLWLLDTGSPITFGEDPQLRIAGEEFPVSTRGLGVSASDIGRFVGVVCRGLIGVDVLDRFDLILDTVGGKLVVSSDVLDCAGAAIPLERVGGLPVIEVSISGARHRMFFDTGAFVSYFEDDALFQFPFLGRVEDFYPTIGAFETDTYAVPMMVGPIAVTLRCGKLPGVLAAAFSLLLSQARGVIGNELIAGRTCGYFPRRNQLVL
ncbi:MAG: hypothetical protein N3C12_01745 [Candidatus Binatia bacterium]|nr:hypothetical protein [Candidatus Binatia bacterium]